MSEIAKHLASGGPPDERPITTFTVPESLRVAGAPQKIGVRDLYADDELAAGRSARLDGKYDPLRSQYEAVKRMIVSVDGERVGVGDGSVDAKWNKWSPKLRSQLLELYVKWSSPTKEESDAFFKSATTSA